MSLTDRQRVELSLPAHMMLAVLIAGVNDPNEDEAQKTRQLLLDACAEPVEDLTVAEKLKIIRRVERTHRDVVKPYLVEGVPIAKIGLIAFYILQALVTARFLIVGEDSHMGRALDLILPALEPSATPELDRSARKQARKCLQQLQRMGYYQGVGVELVGA